MPIEGQESSTRKKIKRRLGFTRGLWNGSRTVLLVTLS
jgi:hypothetical protein